MCPAGAEVCRYRRNHARISAFKLAFVAGLVILQNGVQASPLPRWEKGPNRAHGISESGGALLEKLRLAPFHLIELGALNSNKGEKFILRLPAFRFNLRPLAKVKSQQWAYEPADEGNAEQPRAVWRNP